MQRIRATQRRALLAKARERAKQKIIAKLKPVFRHQYRTLERFLRKSNLRKRLNKIDLSKGEAEGHPFRGNQYTYDYSEVQVVDSATAGVGQRNYWILPNDVVVGPKDSTDMHMNIANKLIGKGTLNSFEGYNHLLESGAIRVDNRRDISILETKEMNTKTLNRIQGLVDRGKLKLGSVTVEWSGTSTTADGEYHEHLVRVTPEELMVSKKLLLPRPGQYGVVLKSASFCKAEELIQSAPTQDKQQWDTWKKAMLVALLLGLFSGMDDLAEVENEYWSSNGEDPLTYDPETLIESYQYRTGLPLMNIADYTLQAVEQKIADWYATDKPFSSLMQDLNKYFNETRLDVIASTETGNLLAQMVFHQMVSYNLGEWYWDAMGEDPCHGDIVISGTTYSGCSDLNGRKFKRGDPMPPDAAHPHCQCLPTPVDRNRTFKLRQPIDRGATFGEQYPDAPAASPIKPDRTQRFLGKGEPMGHPFRGNQWTEGEMSSSEIKSMYYHRSFRGHTDEILSSGFIRAGEDNFRESSAYRTYSDSRPFVIFGAKPSMLQDAHATMTNSVASNLSDISLSDVAIIVYDPRDDSYTNVTNQYNAGMRTEEELIQSLNKEKND